MTKTQNNGSVELLRKMNDEMVWFLFANDRQKRMFHLLYLDMKTGKANTYRGFCNGTISNLLDMEPAQIRRQLFWRKSKQPHVRLVFNPFLLCKEKYKHLYDAVKN